MPDILCSLSAASRNFHAASRRMSTLVALCLTAAMLITGCGAAASATLSPVQSVPAGIGDSYYTELGNPGYDVTHYTIALDVDPASNQIHGTTTIQAIAAEALKSLNLDFQGLTIDEVRVDDSAARYAVQEHELTIIPVRTLEAGSAFTVSVRYHGDPQPILNVARAGAESRSAPVVGWFRAANGAINVLNEPNGAASWFPANDHPRDKATYRFEIRVPDPWIVAASGTLRQVVAGGGGKLYVWEMDEPMASYLASIDIDQYILETSPGPGGVVIRNYLTPGLPDELRANIRSIPRIMEFYDGLFGPYPFSEYGVLIANADIDACRGRGAAVEVQTLSIHCATSRMLDESVLAHELAHQWFGDDVSLENWQDIWLKEGMATYAQWMWEARDRDLNGLTSFIRIQRMLYSHETPIGEPPPGDLYDDEVYLGGAQVFHALRLKVGDPLFFKILRTYLERYRFGNLGTDGFIALAEEVSGQELSAFFDSWLMQATPPEIPAP